MVRSLPPPVIPERYAQALGDADPIESQRKAPKRIRKLLRGLSKKQLARRPEEGKWSIRDVLAHLADGELVVGARLRFVAAMDRPPIIGYDQDAFIANLGYDQVDARELCDDFATLRAMNVALFERLPDEAFARIGLHNERGEESLSSMVYLLAGHDRVHEEQIERIAAIVTAKKRKKKDRDGKRKKK